MNNRLRIVNLRRIIQKIVLEMVAFSIHVFFLLSGNVCTDPFCLSYCRFLCFEWNPKLVTNVAPPSPTKCHNKIFVISNDNVGMAIAQAILTRALTNELFIVDTNADKLRDKMLDL